MENRNRAFGLVSVVACCLGAGGVGWFGFSQAQRNHDLASQLAAESAAKTKLQEEKARLELELVDARAEALKSTDEHLAAAKRTVEEQTQACAELKKKLELAQSQLATENAAREETRRKIEQERTALEEKAAQERRVAEETRAKAETARQIEETEKLRKETEAVKARTAVRQPVNSEQARAARMKGLWETITSGLKKSDRAKVKEMKLSLSGAKEPLTVSYSMQSKRKPLVVIVNGTFSKAQNLYADELEQVFIRSGCHVMTFDSFFSRRFLMQTQLAAPGNLKAEAELSGRIIAAFLKQPGIRDDVSEIAVVGLSYGGGVALQMALLDQEKRLPFSLARVQAYSVPASFRDAIHILDDFEAQPYSYDTILPIVMKAYKSNEPLPQDTTPEMLQKCIGRGFRLDLPETVEAVDRLYCGPIKQARPYVLKTNYLGDPQAETMEREGEAQAVSFTELFEHWLAPYWQGTAHVSGEDLMDMGDLSKILPRLDEKVQIVIARNDPLNAAGAVEELEKIQTKAHLTVLPGGGHLGFLQSEAVTNIAAGLFSGSSGNKK
jgi:predicted alpha/beta-fold hydrolase